METHAYTFIVVLAFVISALDAFSIGANDVANSFATSVASKSLKLWQACLIAAVAEFLGALLLGSGVAETIRKGIVNIEIFKDQPELLMVGMFAANVGSSFVVMGATFVGCPVSTTHAIVGGVIGMGVGLSGTDSVIWGWNSSGKGFGVIAASWFISPLFAGILGAIFYNIVMCTVLKMEDSYNAAKKTIPFFFFFTIGTILFYFAYKGAPVIKALKLEIWQVCLIAFVPAFVFAVLSYVWFLPKFIVPYVEKHYGAGIETRCSAVDEISPKDFELETIEKVDDSLTAEAQLNESKKHGVSSSTMVDLSGKKEGKKAPKPKCSEKVWSCMCAPLYVDVTSLEGEKMIQLHSEVTKYNIKTERLFSFLQVVTATCASFSHGANDLANALSPMATVYSIWLSGSLPDKKFSIPIWQIFYCAIFLDLGLWFLGHTIMKELGNNLTYISPSRGFNMELAAMFTVLTASRLGIPVSTTHCITGATAGVALAEGNKDSFNWNKFGFIFTGWMLTVPVAALVSGSIAAFMVYSPSIDPCAQFLPNVMGANFSKALYADCLFD